MRENPSLVAERVGWLIDGNYGYGSYYRARQVLNQGAGANKSAALAQMIAALEWRVPPRFARAAFKKLTQQEQERLTSAINREIRSSIRSIRQG